MADSTIDKILEKLPYSDGSLRRRFVSGGIVMVGLLVIGSVRIPEQSYHPFRFIVTTDSAAL